LLRNVDDAKFTPSFAFSNRRELSMRLARWNEFQLVSASFESCVAGASRLNAYGMVLRQDTDDAMLSSLIIAVTFACEAVADRVADYAMSKSSDNRHQKWSIPIGRRDSRG
jgi:hypothetical protein